MNLTEITSWLKDKEQRAVADGTQFLEQHLPVIADLADKASTNPVIDAILQAEHLSPDWFASLADVIRKADAALGVAAKAAADAQAAAAAAQAPADPAMGEQPQPA